MSNDNLLIFLHTRYTNCLDFRNWIICCMMNFFFQYLEYYQSFFSVSVHVYHSRNVFSTSDEVRIF